MKIGKPNFRKSQTPLSLELREQRGMQGYSRKERLGNCCPGNNKTLEREGPMEKKKPVL